MKVIQTFQQGGRHKTNNQPCEDRTYHLSRNGVEAIALADGAGSSKYTHSAEGAACVTMAISEFFCNNFDKFYEKQDNDELCAVIMTVCQRALQKKADELSLDSISRLSSTLLSVAIKGDKVICCHIGDGAIGKLTPDGTVVVSSPENGEFASTTFFITNPNADKHIHITKEALGNTSSYFLMSDGTADYIYNKATDSFYDAAKKMALMALDENGQTTLFKTVKTYMVEKDRKSDDCSFIALTFDSARELVSPVPESIDYTPIVQPDIILSSPEQPITENIFTEYEAPIAPAPVIPQTTAEAPKKKRINLIILIAIILCLVATAILAAVLLTNKDKKNEKETTDTKTTVSQSVSDSTKPHTTSPITTNPGENAPTTTNPEEIVPTTTNPQVNAPAATNPNKGTDTTAPKKDPASTGPSLPTNPNYKLPWLDRNPDSDSDSSKKPVSPKK